MNNNDDPAGTGAQSGQSLGVPDPLRPLPDERMLRRYLLGQCSSEESDGVELAALQNNDVSDLLSLIQDELIEEYVDDTLGKEEQAYLSQSAGNRTKIHLSRALQMRVAAHKRYTEEQFRSQPSGGMAPPRSLALGGTARDRDEVTRSHPIAWENGSAEAETFGVRPKTLGRTFRDNIRSILRRILPKSSNKP